MYEYSRKWRFLFNPNNCHLIIISPKKQHTSISVKFGPAIINQTESITYVGIELHQSLKSSSAIYARIQKGWTSLFSVLAIDRDTGFFSPSIRASLVEKICFPVGLYGAESPEAELWHNMLVSDTYKLEKFIRLAASQFKESQLAHEPTLLLECLVGYQSCPILNKESCRFCTVFAQCHQICFQDKYSICVWTCLSSEGIKSVGFHSWLLENIAMSWANKEYIEWYVLYIINFDSHPNCIMVRFGKGSTNANREMSAI